MANMKICPKCGGLMNYSSYFGGYYCASCGKMERDYPFHRSTASEKTP